VLCATLALSPVAAAADPAAPHQGYSEPDPNEFRTYVRGADRLEGRLLAPCCWDSSRQTLDIHGSPVATALRREIRSRLRAGETPEAVEADLVRRYSKKILAVPEGNPLRQLGIVLTAALIVAAFGVGNLLLRWRRRSAVAAPAPATKEPAAAKRDKWDERLENELENFE
jgi:cytochrome c-type biogenesis protein CcmH